MPFGVLSDNSEDDRVKQGLCRGCPSAQTRTPLARLFERERATSHQRSDALIGHRIDALPSRQRGHAAAPISVSARHTRRARFDRRDDVCGCRSKIQSVLLTAAAHRAAHQYVEDSHNKRAARTDPDTAQYVRDSLGFRLDRPAQQRLQLRQCLTVWAACRLGSTSVSPLNRGSSAATSSRRSRRETRARPPPVAWVSSTRS